eukprot:3730403-Rhodomonas_salina.2
MASIPAHRKKAQPEKMHMCPQGGSDAGINGDTAAITGSAAAITESTAPINRSDASKKKKKGVMRA